MMVIFLGIPIFIFLFKEPLTNLVEKNHKKIEDGKVMFLVQGFFELFETMLSYFSNTFPMCVSELLRSAMRRSWKLY